MVELRKKLNRFTFRLFIPLIIFFGFNFYLQYASAIYYGSGTYDSGLYSAILPSVTATPSGGVYSTTQLVALATQSSNTIRYSTISTPVDCASGTLYSTPIEISSSKTIYTLVCDIYNNSVSTNFSYTISPGGHVAIPIQTVIPQVDIVNIENVENKETIKNQTFYPISRVLKIKTIGQDVVFLQNFLKENNFYIGKTDGVFGQQTKAAVISFQKSKGLTPDGIVGKSTLKYLNTKTDLTILNQDVESLKDIRILKISSPAMQGEDVKKLQLFLKENNFYIGKTDGVFGQQTKAAVISFQKSKGLTPDGIVGAETQKSIK